MAAFAGGLGALAEVFLWEKNVPFFYCDSLFILEESSLDELALFLINLEDSFLSG